MIEKDGKRLLTIMPEPIRAGVVNMATRETIEELRELYRQREMIARQLDSVLGKIQKILHEQPDYRAYLDSNGQKPLPDWIHMATGGRPVYDRWKPSKEVKRKKPKQQTAVDSMFNNLMKGFK